MRVISIFIILLLVSCDGLDSRRETTVNAPQKYAQNENQLTVEISLKNLTGKPASISTFQSFLDYPFDLELPESLASYETFTKSINVDLGKPFSREVNTVDVKSAIDFTDNKAIALIVRSIENQTAAIKAKTLTEWVGGYVKYYERTNDRRGAYYALSKQRGDCTEMADLLVVIATHHGIPARVVTGYMLDGSGRADKATKHDWAELLVDGQWVIADPLSKAYNPDPEKYLRLRTGFSEKLTDKLNSLALFTIDNPNIKLGYRLLTLPKRNISSQLISYSAAMHCPVGS